MKSKKIKMKRHESFYIREGWLVKALHSIQNTKDISRVFSVTEGSRLLGIGTNMVKSLKYWVIATSLIKEEGRSFSLTDFAKVILKYDGYLEDDFSLWFLHYHLITNDEALLFNLFFNNNLKIFSKESMINNLIRELDIREKDYNENLLLDEVNVIIKTYVIDEKNTNPENNFICPFSDLKLIKKINKIDFEKIKPKMKQLDPLVIYYSIQQLMEENNYISLDELIKVDNSPVKLFNLDKNMLYDYLDVLKNKSLITINKTAGINIIYLNEILTLEDLFKKYYGGV